MASPGGRWTTRTHTTTLACLWSRTWTSPPHNASRSSPACLVPSQPLVSLHSVCEKIMHAITCFAGALVYHMQALYASKQVAAVGRA